MTAVLAFPDPPRENAMRYSEAGRHRIALPPERQAEQPFVFNPADGRIVCPWPKGKLSSTDQQRLDAVIDKLRRIDADTLIWIWPDDREKVPVAAASPYHWLRHWSRDRACYAA
jgi:hypothetical protein